MKVFTDEFLQTFKPYSCYAEKDGKLYNILEEQNKNKINKKKYATKTSAKLHSNKPKRVHSSRKVKSLQGGKDKKRRNRSGKVDNKGSKIKTNKKARIHKISLGGKKQKKGQKQYSRLRKKSDRGRTGRRKNIKK